MFVILRRAMEIKPFSIETAEVDRLPHGRLIRTAKLQPYGNNHISTFGIRP